MKKLHFLFIAVILLFSSITEAQTYFQQEVNYTINVKLDDVFNEIKADESIEYINNSPNTLSFIYMHLWPNAYKDNTTAFAKQLLENGNTKFYYAKENAKGRADGAHQRDDRALGGRVDRVSRLRSEAGER